MAVVTISPPDPLAELALVKQHLRVDFPDDDTLIDLYVAAASGHIDGVGAYLGRAIGEQTLELRVDSFADLGARCAVPRSLALPYGPATSVVSITFEDDGGEDQNVLDAHYRLSADGSRLFVDDGPWLDGRNIRIRYVVGSATPPKPIVAAVLLMVGDLYAHRESDSSGAAEIHMSGTVENLLRPYRDLTV